jgi:hypothetical protein
MGNFQALDIGLGLMFIYLVLSLVCTGLNEFVAGIFHRRRRNLLKGLEFILTHRNNSNLVEDFKNHPLIQSLYGNNFQASYVPPHIFSTVLLDLLHKADPKTPRTMDDIRQVIAPPQTSGQTSPSSVLYETLRVLAHEAENNVAQLKKNIEKWYNEAMVGTSGRYRARTQAIVFAIAAVVAFGTNADTFELTKTLSQDSALRAALVAQTEKLKDDSADTAIPPLTLDDLKKTGLQLGWDPFPTSMKDVSFKKFMGLLITAIAISLGAPFWFDLLKKVANVRAGSLSPDEVEKEKKKSQST